MKSLFRATRSVGCLKDSCGFPRPVTVSLNLPAWITAVILEFGFPAIFLNSRFKSEAPFDALTATMQSPRKVKCDSFVTSNVVS